MNTEMKQANTPATATPASVTPDAAKADVPVYQDTVVRNGVTVKFAKTEAERSKGDADKMTFWHIPVAQFVPAVTPVPATVTDATKRKELEASALETSILEALAIMNTVLGNDSDGKAIVLEMIESKIRGSCQAAQKEKGKDTLSFTVKLERAKDWLTGLNVARVAKRSALDVSMDTMKSEVQAAVDAEKLTLASVPAGTTAEAIATIGAQATAVKMAAITKAMMSHQARVMELATAGSSDMLTAMGIKL